MAIILINPYTEKLIKTYAPHTPNQVEEIIASVNEDWFQWRETSFEVRKKCMLSLAENLKNNLRNLSILITSEMGKPIKQSEAEVLKCALVCEYYAENAESFLSKNDIKTDASQSYVQYDPLGIIFAVMPWNFPFWQVFRFAAPALMAGNAALLKHASNVSGCALEIEKLFSLSGFPPNIFRSLLMESNKVELVIENPLVKAVTLTGSESAGISVASAGGKNLKKTVLELGGSDPFIILNDANISEAVKGAILGRILNNGQSCIAAKRFIINSQIADGFLSQFVSEMETLKIGNPMLPEVEIGPLAKKEFVTELHSQVNQSIRKGAKKLTKAIELPPTGFFFPPTVLSEVKPGMPAYDEELFGPVASVIIVNDEEEAVQIANDTEFGLGASIWTKDIDLAQKMAEKIDSGSVFINGIVKSDPRLPFGGVKKSGFGRELSSQGIREFVNIKTVWIK